MAFNVFSKQEIEIAKTLSIWGISIIVMVAVFSGLVHVIDVYMHDGQAGLTELVKGSATGKDTLKESIDTEIVKNKPAPVVGELPLTITIPSLNINAKVEAPGAASVEVLDAALKRGPVYYNGSGYPGVRNMLIFGHSTGFSIVRNQAYKVFNTIKNGKVGEIVYVRSISGVSTYRITGVRRASKYNTWIRFDSDKPMLTLATCDSFGKASDRWVLEADFVSFAAGK